ncbi:hypothetical protein ACWD7Y_05230 [Streptomyces drozdowiczii]
MKRPITPTRIIPAGAPLPDRGPLPGEVPPWWERPAAAPPAVPPTPPAPPAAPAPPPAPVPAPVHVHVTLQPGPYYDQPEPTARERLTAWVRGRFGRPWQIAGALLLTVLPVPGTHYSAAATWAYATGEARAEWGALTGYALALIPLAWACTRAARHGATVLRLCCIVIAAAGLLGVLDPFDLVTAYTGVHR